MSAGRLARWLTLAVVLLAVLTVLLILVALAIPETRFLLGVVTMIIVGGLP